MCLITASDLQARQGTLGLLDARPSAEDYRAGHLPGAFHAPLDTLLSAASDAGHDPARGGRHPLPPIARFAAQLGAWGIGPRQAVAVYDAQGGSHAAARLWWMLRALGHASVAVLDGGLPAALEAGLALTTEVPVVAPLPPYPANRWGLPLADAEAVEALRRDPAWALLDVRTAERWRGDEEPLDPVAGHIPGSINLTWSHNLGPDGRFKTPEALRRQFLSLLGGIPPEQVAVHCGSGVTACHTLLALEVAGLSGAALYVGSWSEWCRSGRDKAKGEP